VPGLHPLPSEGVSHALRHGGSRSVGSKERAVGQVAVELRPVGDGAARCPPNTSMGVPLDCRALDHDRWHGRDQYGLGNPVGAVAPDVAGDLAAGGRSRPGVGLGQVERVDDRGQVVGIVVRPVPVISTCTWRPWWYA
jgi:hypothetical protein